jgi:hypothetical protein
VRVFCLTPLTRGAGSQRRVVVKGFDLPARALLIAGLAFPPAAIVAAIAWSIVGQMGIFAIPVVEGLAFWLIEARTRSGLRLRTYQALNDKRRAKRDADKFFVAGREYDPLGEEWGRIVPSSAPVPPKTSLRAST